MGALALLQMSAEDEIVKVMTQVYLYPCGKEQSLTCSGQIARGAGRITIQEKDFITLANVMNVEGPAMRYNPVRQLHLMENQPTVMPLPEVGARKFVVEIPRRLGPSMKVDFIQKEVAQALSKSRRRQLLA